MPQLVKGGKHVFGWSKVSDNGEIKISKEVMEEYNLQPSNKVFIISGSKTSGGFSIVKNEVLKNSKISLVVKEHPSLADFSIKPGELIKFNNRFICWTEILEKEKIHLPIETLHVYGIKPKDTVLSVRGSGLGVGFIVRGPIIQEAKKHPELKVYE